MKETRILFTPENIRLILEGLKTETRRSFKFSLLSKSDGAKRRVFLEKDAAEVRQYISERQRDPMKILCPYGQIGDRLWVKEGWGLGGARLIDPTINYRAGGQKQLIGHASPDTWSIAGNRHEVNDADLLAVKEGWHNAMFMPKWAARIWLEITQIRIQRVQEIGEEDCIAEGCPKEYLLGVNWYKNLWDQINGKTNPWSSNPWVWVLTFKQMTGRG